MKNNSLWSENSADTKTSDANYLIYFIKNTWLPIYIIIIYKNILFQILNICEFYLYL